MSRVLILISAIFVFIYSNNETINKKIIGYTYKGNPIYCDQNQTEGNQTSSMNCISYESNTSENKTMITFNTSLKIKDGWNIVGIAHNIENVKEFLSKDCILHARKYKDDVWQEYNALDGTNTIDKISSNDAIYIYSTGECELNSYGARTFDKDEIKIQNVINPIAEENDKNSSVQIESVNTIIQEDTEVKIETEESTKETIEQIKDTNTTEQNTSTTE